MKYTIYEDSPTHEFALLRLPSQFVEDDKLTIVATDRWFGSQAPRRFGARDAIDPACDSRSDVPRIMF
jgi:hypothetical protein